MLRACGRKLWGRAGVQERMRACERGLWGRVSVGVGVCGSRVGTGVGMHACASASAGLTIFKRGPSRSLMNTARDTESKNIVRHYLVCTSLEFCSSPSMDFRRDLRYDTCVLAAAATVNSIF